MARSKPFEEWNVLLVKVKLKLMEDSKTNCPNKKLDSNIVSFMTINFDELYEMVNRY